MFNQPAAFVGILDPEGRLIRANEPALEFVDADAADVEGLSFPETPWWDDADVARERVRDAVERAATGEVDTFTARHRAPDGEAVVLDVRVDPVVEDGEVLAIVVAGRDVTERERLADELRRDREALREFYRIASDAETDFDERVRRLLELGCDRLGLPIGFVSSIDPGADPGFEVVAAIGDHDLIRPDATAPLSRTYCRRAIESDSLLAVRDASEDGWTGDPAYERFDLGCYLGGKLLVDGELYGTLCFADTAPRTESFTDAERTFVELLTEWLGGELERREYERDLVAARERFERTLERIDDAFFALDADWAFTYLNGRAADLLGVDPDAVVGESVWAEFPEAVGSAFEDEYTRAMETQTPVSFEEFYPPLETWFEVNAYPSPEGLSVFFRDVTDRKRHEESLAGLVEETRSLMRAETEADVAAVAADAAERVMGFELAVVWLYDEEADALVPVEVTEAAAERFGDVDAYPIDEAVVGRAYRTNEAVTLNELPATPSPAYRSLESAMALPIGDHGALLIGSARSDAFDDTDRRLAALLTANAAVAIDRARNRAELRRYESVVENVQDMVYVLDADGRFTLVTEPLAEWLGYDREDLLGEHVSTVLTEDGVEEGQAVVRDLAGADRRSRAYRTQGVTADGDRIPVEIEISLLPGDEFRGSVGVVRDIGDLIRARTRLEDERDRFEYLFEHIPDAVVEVEFVDGRPIVRAVNPAFVDTFGYGADELAGESLNEFILPPEDRPEGEALDRRAIAGETTSVEVRRRTAEGARTFLFRGVAYEREGSTYGFGIYTDITEREERERYLEVINRVLRHNLRNDLNVVLAYSSRLRRQLDDPDLADVAELLEETAAGLAELSEEAKEIERSIGRRPEDELPVDAAAVAREVADGHRSAAPDATIDLDLPEECWIDGGSRLRRALAELVENAIEHHDGDAPAVEIGIDAGDDWVEISVVDDGPGMPAHERRIVSGDTDITQLEHGSGLGLWLVRWIVESYGGSLAFEDRPGGGSAVVLRLRRGSAP